MRIKSILAGIALACLSVSSAFAADNAGPWVETTTPVLASATYTGTSHYLIAAGSGTGGASFFGGQFYADQDGTAYIDSSNDGTTWTVASTKALTATHTVDLNVPLRASYYRVRFVNGGTNQGAFRVFAAQTQSGAAGQTTDGAGAAGGGGAGDASAANQTSQITQETAINTVLGAKADAKNAATDTTAITLMQVQKEISFVEQAISTLLGSQSDAACGTDNGTCSLAGLVKRGNQNATTLNTTASSALPAQSSDGVKIGAVQGTVASGSTADTYPLLMGGRGATTAPTAVTDGQTVRAQFTETGRFVTAPYSIKELMVRGTATSTDTSAHTIIASAGGSLKNYITAVQCGRTDAGASALTITFNDSASTVVVLPAGGATNIQLPTPLATAAATAFQFTSGTGVSTLYCSAQGYTGL